jgi:hypothetical protein
MKEGSPAASKRSQDIARLRDLIKNLPSSLPIHSAPVNRADPTQMRNVYPVFSSFEPDADWLERTDDLMGAVTRVFKSVFGWNADQDRATVFIACGKDVEVIIDVLEKYSTPMRMILKTIVKIYLARLASWRTLGIGRVTLLLSAVSAFEEAQDKMQSWYRQRALLLSLWMMGCGLNLNLTSDVKKL